MKLYLWTYSIVASEWCSTYNRFVALIEVLVFLLILTRRRGGSRELVEHRVLSKDYHVYGREKEEGFSFALTS